MSESEIVHPESGRFEELREDSHIRAMAERARQVLEVAMGVRDCPALDQLVHNIAHQVAILEANPEHKITWGLVLVTQRPMDGWSVYVRSADIFRMHLDGFFKESMDLGRES